MTNADPTLATALGVLAFATLGASVIAGAALEAWFERRSARRP